MIGFRVHHSWAAALATLGLALVAAPAALVSASAAWASPGPVGPGLQPVSPGPNGYFEGNLPPGGHESFSVLVRNLSGATATYRVYSADGTTSAVTGVEYSQANATPSQAGSWITVETPTVTLTPGAAREVAFNVSVPAGAVPGDHVGAIASDSPVAARSQGQGAQGSSNVALNITSRVVVAVVIHVPGPAKVAMQVGRPSFGIESGGRQTLLIPLNDNGDLLFKPHIAGAVTPCDATTPILTFDRQLDTFVPHTAITYAYHISTSLPQGCYKVVVRADHSGAALGTYEGSVQLGPRATHFSPSGPTRSPRPGLNRSGRLSTAVAVVGTLAAVLCLGVLGLLLFILWRRRRREDEARGADQPHELDRSLTPSG